ncbi:MAG: discoidin domain-containing protein [Pseudomonadaceae bacterium]|nr:discoidin domain-containing protein [Pseudomonadaceae bacterium]
MAACRYWRLFVSATNGGANVAIGELAMAESPGGTNVCTGGTPASSSAWSATYLPAKAFDGSNAANNGWRSAGPVSEWIQYDFGGTPRDIVELKVSFPVAGTIVLNEAPKAFVLYCSDDGIKWELRRGWSEQVFASNEVKTYDATPIPAGSIANRIRPGKAELRYNSAATSQAWVASVISVRNLCRDKNSTKPYRFNTFTGRKRIAGVTTSLGQPISRRVDLFEQKSGLLVDSIFTKDDGLYEFKEVADTTYMLVGTDVRAEQNSIVFAHVTPVD